MVRKSLIARALELAASGEHPSKLSIVRQLKRDGYLDVDSHLEGRDLQNRIKAARRGALQARPATTFLEDQASHTQTEFRVCQHASVDDLSAPQKLDRRSDIAEGDAGPLTSTSANARHERRRTLQPKNYCEPLWCTTTAL